MRSRRAAGNAKATRPSFPVLMFVITASFPLLAPPPKGQAARDETTESSSDCWAGRKQQGRNRYTVRSIFRRDGCRECGDSRVSRGVAVIRPLPKEKPNPKPIKQFVIGLICQPHSPRIL